jgi:hypothetical protein
MKKVASYEVTANGVTTPYNGGGVTRGAHLIEFAWIDYPRPESMRNNIVHELGHAFNVNRDPYPADSLPDNYKDDRNLFLHNNKDPGVMWQADLLHTDSETFADMFVAYTYGVWGNWNDPINADLLKKHNPGDPSSWNPPQWMDDHMRTWTK